ncbi:Scr1 family TA system antitoxin-like transcriptional regulator [Stenotrophomonas sp. NPDC087984]
MLWDGRDVRAHLCAGEERALSVEAAPCSGTQPYVTIQVLPFRAGQHVEAGGSLLLYTLPNEPLLAYEEGSRFGTFIEDLDRVAERRKNYDLLRAMALSPLDSEAMIRAVMKDWTSWEPPQI